MTTFLIFSDDWGRHPSSCQHLTRFLIQNEKHNVFWVNTIGTRPPGFNLLTLRRGVEKIASWIWKRPKGKRCETLENTDATQMPHVFQPIMLPWFRRRWQRWINQKLLIHQLSRTLGNEKNVVAVTTLPITADLIGSLPCVSRWVYYCVDDWSRWPGMDARPLAEMEAKMIPLADKIVAAGVELQNRIRSLGRDSLLLTHGIDLEFWDPAKQENETNHEITNIPHPLLVFWGLIDERLDMAILEYISREFPFATILMAGPIATTEGLQKLEKLPNFRYMGVLPYKKLPKLAAQADVLLMPYVKNEMTEQIQPLKMTEYLASGKPAVVRDLHASQAWADALDIASTPEEFAYFIHLRLKTGLPLAQRSARERLENETWKKKAQVWETYMME